MRPSSGQFLCVCVASLCLAGICEVPGLTVATMLTLVACAVVNHFRAAGEPVTDPRPRAAPALVRLH
ncbi:hypothetical protein ABIE33_003425 [Ensifer sp. 4252]